MSECYRDQDNPGECAVHPGATFLFGDVCEEAEALDGGAG